LSKTFDVVTFGEAMAMFVAEQSGPLERVELFSRKMAGAEANVAIGLARLGYRVGWMSKVGADPFGTFILNNMNHEQVDTAAVRIESSLLTGFQLKGRANNEEDPIVRYYRRNSAASTMNVSDFNASYYLNARHLHVTGVAAALSPTVYELAEVMAKQAKSAGMTVSFDPNLRPSLWQNEASMREGINRLAKLADWILPGLQEGRLLTGYSEPSDIAACFLDWGAQAVCIKLGPEGAYGKTADREFRTPAYPVPQIVDTVGAGDGFAVGYISAMLDGLAPEEAARRGAAIGAIVVTSPGDSDGLPTAEQLDQFMQKREAKIE